MRSIVLITVLLLGMQPAVTAGDAIETAGDITQLALPATACWMTRSRHDDDGKRMFFRSFLSSMAVTYALKYSIDDTRPVGTNENSFVSAHTAAAFSGAAFMQRRYGWKWGVPAYAAASFVGWSRVHAGKHHTDDVLRGAAIAIAGSYWFTKPLSRNAWLQPMVGPGTVGVMVSARW